MPSHALYHADLRRVRERIASQGPGLPRAQYRHLPATDGAPVVEYHARAVYANTHGGDPHLAAPALLDLLAAALEGGHLHQIRTFHEVVHDDHLLVLSPDARSVIAYHRLRSPGIDDTTPPAPAPAAAIVPSPRPRPTPAPPPARAAAATRPGRDGPVGTATATELLSQWPYTAQVTFSSPVLTWAGAAPGQSHTRLAIEVRRSIHAAARAGRVTPGRDGTHRVTDGTWQAVLSPDTSKVLFAGRVEHAVPDTDDPDRVAPERLAQVLTSDAVDSIVATPAILAAAGPAPGQSHDDLRAELLDALDAALEDGLISVGFSGRHQLFGDGWLLVLSPSGTHLVTARRSP